ncbi:hypothetical protein RIF29_27847 [Crotalaria pallida]|uniref:Uncharacterized protein n=1 Tax=Crotalaria pallida TaxID=3830 RepID=A0AAN9HZ51_CROPI
MHVNPRKVHHFSQMYCPPSAAALKKGSKFSHIPFHSKKTPTLSVSLSRRCHWFSGSILLSKCHHSYSSKTTLFSMSELEQIATIIEETMVYVT